MLKIKETAKIHHATKAKAERFDAAFRADYPALAIEPVYNEDESQIVAWLFTHNVPDESDPDHVREVTTDVLRVEKLSGIEIGDIFEACDEAGVDPEDIEPEEVESGGSVVPEGYRIYYREASSNGQTCGDWLAEFLTGQLHGENGFDVDGFTDLLSENGVDLSGPGWAMLPESGQKGWIGRYRMNGRQQLEKLVALRGTVLADGQEYRVPSDELAILQNKHAKWIDKQIKARKEAETKEAA